MFKLKYTMFLISACMFMLGDIDVSAMRQGSDDSKKPRLPKFEKEFYSSYVQDDDSGTEEDEMSIVYGTQSSNSQSSNTPTQDMVRMEEEHFGHLNQDSGSTTEEDPELWRVYNSQRSNSTVSETEEMQLEYEPNAPIIVDDDFQFTVIPDDQVMIPVNDRWVRLEVSNLKYCIVGEFAITQEINNPEWQELKQLFLDGAFDLEKFIRGNRISRTYMGNMNKLYRYMRRHNLLGAFPNIAAFFDRWIALQNRH